MISLEEVRQVVIGAFKTVQDIAYPSMLVNYPNFTIVDLERHTVPFVSVELELPDTEQAALGEDEIFVRGVLVAYYYYKVGAGMSGALSYTDFLNDKIAMKAMNSIQYEATSVINVQTFPGWKGSMNSIPFSVVSTPSC